MKRRRPVSPIAAEVQTLEERTLMSSTAILISKAEIAALPKSGAAWDYLVSQAKKTGDTPRISDQESQNDTLTLARALVGVRNNDYAMIAKVRNDIIRAIGTEANGETLALGRNLPAYIVAAGIIDLQSLDPAGDLKFRSYLSSVRNKTLAGKTLISTHEGRPNNWGTHAGAARIAIDLYIGDTVDLAKAIKVHKGWLGDRASYSGFKYGDLSWQSNKSAPVGINPVGATIGGHSVDGALPEEMRRSGGFRWPPPKENYAWEALQGAVLSTELLYRAGHTDAYLWSNKAILRAVKWLSDVAQFQSTGDDNWLDPIINRRYGTSYGVVANAQAGKNLGYTAWMYQ